MEQLTLKTEQALELYKNSNDAGKQLLKQQFGEDIFIGTDYDPFALKTVEDCCRVLKKDSSTWLPYLYPENSFQRWLNSIATLAIIAEALNKGWKPNWKDKTQKKWVCVFESNEAGFGFAHDLRLLAHGYGRRLSALLGRRKTSEIFRNSIFKRTQ